MGVPPRDAQNAKCVGLYTFCSRLDTTEAFRRHIVTMVVRENKVSNRLISSPPAGGESAPSSWLKHRPLPDSDHLSPP